MPSSFGSLHPIDGLLVLGYLCALSGIGIYFFRKQKSLDDFVRGGRQIGWFAMGLSLMAALNSGTDYVQTPAVVYAFGIVFLALIFSWIPLYPWVTKVTVPFYRRLGVYSVYEYLESRFNVRVRLLAATIFVFWRIGWMSIALYVPCLVVKGATGGEMDTTWLVVLLGVVVTTYTMMGGMKAVVWTDVSQFCVMFGGLFAIFYCIVQSIPGGVSEMIHISREAGRLRWFAEIPGTESDSLPTVLYHYFTTEVTFLGILLMVLLGRLAAFTSDQVAVQRFQMTRNDREARNVFLVNAFSDVVWMIVLGAVGLAMFAFYHHQGVPEGMQNDQLLPYFLGNFLPVGVAGLVIAGVIAASLSSVDAALNSTTSVIVVDFYNRLIRGEIRPDPNASVHRQKRELRISRIINGILGLVIMGIATQAERLGEIYRAMNKTIGAFFGTLFGIFLLGMFFRKANSTGVLVGALTGLFVSCFFAFFSELVWLQEICGSIFGKDFVKFTANISWQWPPLLGIAATLTVGQMVSVLTASQSEHEDVLTYRQVMDSTTFDNPGSIEVGNS